MKTKIEKQGNARKILDNDGKVICEEVVCLGNCKGTFFRKGSDIGKHGIRKCSKCQGRDRKQSGWASVWGISVSVIGD